MSIVSIESTRTAGLVEITRLVEIAISLVSMEITRIAGLVEIAIVVEIVISCENHDFQRNYKGTTSNQACRKSLIFLRKYQ